MNKNKGFSLIELIIVLTVISILSAYAMPTFRQLRQNKAIESARNSLFVELQFARTKAIMSQSYIVVCPSVSNSACADDANWHKGWIVFIDKNHDKKYNNNDEILRIGNAMQPGVSAISSNYRKKIRFNGLGFAPGTNLSINFCDERGNDFAQAIIISNSGRVKQSKPINDNVCNF